MSQIRLSEVLPGKALQWPEFFVRNIPNTRLESRVIPSTQCFEYLYYHTKHGDILFITGGEKDVLSLAAHGFNAISMNSETANIPKNLLRALKLELGMINGSFKSLNPKMLRLKLLQWKTLTSCQIVALM